MLTKNIIAPKTNTPSLVELSHSFVKGAFYFNNMKKICGIYKITSPSNKVYIGQSVNIRSRFSHYKCLLCENQPRLYNSLKKHGADNHKFEIIHICLPEQLNKLERYYVDLYQSFNSDNGLNLKEGGGNTNCKMSDETKAKLSKTLKGRKISKESIIKGLITKKENGIPRSEESKEKTREYNRNRVLSEETHLKMSQSQKNKPPITEETRQKLRIARAKRKPYTNETKKKISMALSGKNNPMYGMSGEKNPFYGKKHSDETKKIISDKIKLRKNAL